MRTTKPSRRCGRSQDRWLSDADRVRRAQIVREQAGFTLVELLVVIGILLLLLAIALPRIGTGIEEQRKREASRGVNAFLAGARDKAISLGRPYGVQLNRFHAGATVAAGATADQRGLNTCMTLSYVEVPPPYAGDSLYSRMMITVNGSSQSVIQFVGEIDNNGNPLAPDTSWPFMVKVGDRVQIGYQGHMFYIQGPDSNNDGYIDNPVGCILYSETSTWPVATGSRGVPYQVFRAPVKSGAATYQLPEGTVIDLSNSGVYGAEFAVGSTEKDPVTIMFGPSGGITEVMVRPFGQSTVSRVPLTGSVYLLVGEPQNVPTGFAANSIPMSVNTATLTNLWVSINARTGLIQTNEMAIDPSNATGVPLSIFEARTYAREKRGMGGR